MKAEPPAVALLGESVLRVGAALLMLKVRAAEMPPPGAGVTTVTWAVPAVAISAAEMAAVSWVVLTKVVVRVVPFQLITEAVTKLLPVTVKVNPAPPAVALVGERVLSTGTGLFV